MKELISRTLTGIGLVALVGGSIILGPEAFLIVLLAVYFLGVMELCQLYRKVHSQFRWAQTLPGALILIATYLVLFHQLSPLWFLLPLGLWGVVVLRAGMNFPAMLSFIWLAIPLGSILGTGWEHQHYSYNYIMPLSLMILIWLNDTFAYIFGRLLGKNKMTPDLSPGKTWEGFIGGAVITIFLAGLGEAFLGTYPLAVWLIIGLIIVTLGLAGDLFESGLKRSLKVKDSGNLLPGHGGILDRFDSMLFVAPPVFILVLIYQIVVL